MSGNRQILLTICATLAIVVLLVYWQTLSFEFTNYDDPTYVTGNSHVKAGLTADGVKWAFTTRSGSNWHPLTWLSHMLDWQMFGDRPGLHHLTNVLFHLANTILLFFILRRMTGAIWPSALAAALFAAHPLHVESVAWVAERKDVLSASFWMLTLWAYSRYVEGASFKRYCPVLIFFGMGLMSKPMVVTLPFSLLLLDYWPLGRTRGTIRLLLLEKIPLFVMSAISGAYTYLVQQQGNAVAGLRAIALGSRISNAAVSYLTYLGRTIWPLRLAVFYPYHRSGFRPWFAVAAVIALAAVTAVTVAQRVKRPYLMMGWIWYLVTLAPVIGLIQVGEQATADRYMYIPSIGLFVALAWFIDSLAGGAKESGGSPSVQLGRFAFREPRTVLLTVMASVSVSALIAAARVQTGYWRDSVTLFRHALAVTKDNYVAHNNLGAALAAAGSIEDAAKEYQEALRINPADPETNYNMGLVLADQHRYAEALEFYRASMSACPDCDDVQVSMGDTFATLDHFPEAMKCYRKALQLNPENEKAHNNLAIALFRQGKLDESILEYRRALTLKPDFKEAHSNLALALFRKGDYAGAWREAHLARKYGAKLKPGFLNALSWKMPEPLEKP
jgi:tetratricopeptide (TPR) repeat protein